MTTDPRLKFAEAVTKVIGHPELGQNLHLYDINGNELYESDIVKTIPINPNDITRYNKIESILCSEMNNGMYSFWGWYFRCLDTNEEMEIFGITKFGFNKNLKYFRIEKQFESVRY